MKERLTQFLFLEEIIEKYPAQDNLSVAKDPVTREIRHVFSRVHRNEENKIVYIEPGSIRWLDDASS